MEIQRRDYLVLGASHSLDLLKLSQTARARIQSDPVLRSLVVDDHVIRGDNFGRLFDRLGEIDRLDRRTGVQTSSPDGLTRAERLYQAAGGDLAHRVRLSAPDKPRMGIFGSYKAKDPDVPPLARGWSLTPNPPPAPQNVFEDPSAWTPAGAARAMDAYQKLSPSARKLAFDLSYANGNLQKTLTALGPNYEQGPYANSVRELLNFAEEKEAQNASGRTTAQMAQVQAAFLKPDPSIAPTRVFPAATPTNTRYDRLSAADKASWDRRGNAAIASLVAYASVHAPELGLSASNFHLKFAELDTAAVGAWAATDGPNALKVGFEFTAAVEANPGYMLCVVQHELRGHSGYPIGFEANLYEMARKSVPGAAPGGGTYGYYPSEMYSVMRGLPYWVPASASDVGRRVPVPEGSIDDAGAQTDPKKVLAYWVGELQSKWDPSLHVPLLRGFYQRAKLDPAMPKASVAALEGIIRSKFSAADADRILN
jgi:hypothetical protein